MTTQKFTAEQYVAHGQASLAANEISDGIQCFKNALDIEPGNEAAKAGLGLGLAVFGEFDAAQPLLEHAVTLAPRDTRLLDALAITYMQSGHPEDAEVAFRKSLRIGGTRTETLVNLASVLNECGKFSDAEAMFRNCLRRDPDHALARYNLGLLELLNGNLSAGWPAFELRNIVVGRRAPIWAEACVAPDWVGENINGRSILIYAEQGLGDTIQFVRYCTILASMGARVILQCQLMLVDLLKNVDGVASCISIDDHPPDVDFKASLLSLPLHVRTTLEDIPVAARYIPVENTTLSVWQHKFSLYGTQPKVGLVWSGNPRNKTDYKRSIALEMMQPLLNRADISFFNLQIGDAAEQATQLQEVDRLHRVFEEIQPFGDVAAVIQCLDLVITVDTALAHLSGALGKPVWTLISHFPDWRWMLNCDDTPWYPSMRLFRQPAVNDWPSVIDNVQQALDHHKFD